MGLSSWSRRYLTPDERKPFWSWRPRPVTRLVTDCHFLPNTDAPPNELSVRWMGTMCRTPRSWRCWSRVRKALGSSRSFAWIRSWDVNPPKVSVSTPRTMASLPDSMIRRASAGVRAMAAQSFAGPRTSCHAASSWRSITASSSSGKTGSCLSMLLMYAGREDLAVPGVELDEAEAAVVRTSEPVDVHLLVADVLERGPAVEARIPARGVVRIAVDGRAPAADHLAVRQVTIGESRSHTAVFARRTRPRGERAPRPPLVFSLRCPHTSVQQDPAEAELIQEVHVQIGEAEDRRRRPPRRLVLDAYVVQQQVRQARRGALRRLRRAVRVVREHHLRLRGGLAAPQQETRVPYHTPHSEHARPVLDEERARDGLTGQSHVELDARAGAAASADEEGDEAVLDRKRSGEESPAAGRPCAGVHVAVLRIAVGRATETDWHLPVVAAERGAERCRQVLHLRDAGRGLPAKGSPSCPLRVQVCHWRSSGTKVVSGAAGGTGTAAVGTRGRRRESGREPVHAAPGELRQEGEREGQSSSHGITFSPAARGAPGR